MPRTVLYLVLIAFLTTPVIAGVEYDEKTRRGFERLLVSPEWSPTKPGRNEAGLLTARHGPTGLTFVLLPAGSFVMGSDSLNPMTRPAHTVHVPAFLISATECTQEAWDRIGGRDDRGEKGARLPVAGVNCVDLAVWAKKAGLTLPSEAEWEYACRAGTTSHFSFGNEPEPAPEHAWYARNSGGRIREVGTLAPNAFGLYDMHGNVWEWTLDFMHANFEGAPTDGSAWRNPPSSRIVIRGGCFADDVGHLTSAARMRADPNEQEYYLGFRPVMKLPPTIDAVLDEVRPLLDAGRNDAARKKLERIALHDPEDATVQLMLARACLGRGDTRAAESAAIRAMDLGADSNRILGEVRMARGDAARRKQADAATIAAWYRDAADRLRAAVEADPSDRDALTLLGEALESGGADDAAVVVYEEMIAESPDHPGGYRRLGAILSRRANATGNGTGPDAAAVRQQAFDVFDRGEKAAGPDSETLYFKGLALEWAGRPDEAVEAYETAVRTDPSNDPAWRRLQKKGWENDRLIALAREVLVTHPANPIAAVWAGYLLQKNGEHEAALAILIPALEVHREDTGIYKQAHDAAGELFKTGRATSAIAAFSKIHECYPFSGSAANNLGLYFSAVGATRLSTRWYDAALEREPDVQDVLNDAGLVHLYQREGEARQACLPYFLRAVELVREEGEDPQRGYWDALENLCKYHWEVERDPAKVREYARLRYEPVDKFPPYAMTTRAAYYGRLADVAGEHAEVWDRPGRAHAAEAAFEKQRAVRKMVAEMKERVARDRGLPWKQDVPAHVLTVEESTARAEEALARDNDAEEWRKANASSRRLGLIGEDDDLAEIYKDRSGGSAAGFYDPKEKELFLVGDTVSVNDAPVVYHELIHALEDQHHDLGKEMEETRDDGDRHWAFRAIREGSATHASERFKETYRPNVAPTVPDPAKLQARQKKALEMLAKIPGHMIARSRLLYSMGTRFVRSYVGDDYGTRMDELLADPPTSQEQLMHPRKWLSDRRDYPQQLEWGTDLAAVAGEGWKILADSPSGELDLALWLDHLLNLDTPKGPGAPPLANYGKRAARAAAGWDGGLSALIEKDGEPMIWVQVWAFDTEPDAEEAVETVLAAFRARYGDEFDGGVHGDDGQVRFTAKYGAGRIVRRGKHVFLVEGSTEERADAMLAAALTTKFTVDPRDTVVEKQPEEAMSYRDETTDVRVRVPNDSWTVTGSEDSRGIAEFRCGEVSGSLICQRLPMGFETAAPAYLQAMKARHPNAKIGRRSRVRVGRKPGYVCDMGAGPGDPTRITLLYLGDADGDLMCLQFVGPRDEIEALRDDLDWIAAAIELPGS